MIGETKPNHQPKQNIFCIWKGGEPADFEFKAQYRLDRHERKQRHSIPQHREDLTSRNG